MLVKQLIDGYNGEFADVDVSYITCDSRKVNNDTIFVCIDGAKIDGHNFAKAAYNDGAKIIVCQKDLGLDNQIIVEDTRKTFAKMSANYFGNPSKKLRLIGVTGTNGKTSVTYMLKSILEQAGHKVGVIGTIQNMIDNVVVESHNTTPGPYELNELFSKMVSAGCEFAVMEVSSHALDQNRVYGLDFEVAIFTNLTQDHLDYHKTMENYLLAKKKLFSMCKTAVINSSDEYAALLTEGLSCKVITYSDTNDSTYSAKGIKYRPDSVTFELVSDSSFDHITVRTGGKFTVFNSMAVAVAAIMLGIDTENIIDGLYNINGVKGRAEVVPTGRDFTVIIDYAHTPDGLKNILLTFKECEKNRLVILFGCGGDRDKTKRPIMGDIATRYADYAIVTSDNPRTEDPSSIIEDILEGTTNANIPVKVIENRVEAINFAIKNAMPGDIIVLAGKGHETYQILKEGTIHLDEREVVFEALKQLP
ncbi:MAG: UDP-N-acetylmuramoyl-L-alanyl-D-glutamate--2,6-diaminopimelate ligase [Clostridia bacterium]|nr:UDP-N-acetylmuramoyl-L-alanyl-D-glutamate--2,6-diaminopimelate ligase [Clostridia bacterium]